MTNYKIMDELKELESMEEKLECLKSLEEHREAYYSILYKYHKLCKKMGIKPLYQCLDGLKSKRQPPFT